MIIAIDGPAASGKGTLGKRLAAHYGLRHLDTGLLYRAVAKAVLDAGDRPDDAARAVAAARSLDPTTFDEAALKSPGVGERSEEHTSELQSHVNLVCRLLLAKKTARR